MLYLMLCPADFFGSTSENLQWNKTRKLRTSLKAIGPTTLYVLLVAIYFLRELTEEDSYHSLTLAWPLCCVASSAFLWSRTLYKRCWIPSFDSIWACRRIRPNWVYPRPICFILDSFHQKKIHYLFLKMIILSVRNACQNLSSSVLI